MKILSHTKLYIVVLLSVMVFAVWTLVIGSSPLSRNAKGVRVVIAKGSTARRVAEILGEQGVIRSPFVFSLTCRISGFGAKIKPGVYELSPAMSVQQIIRELVAGDSLETWLVVPEGYTARQIADTLQAKKLASSEEFLRFALTKGYDFPEHPFIYRHNLEGYLFPDTYLIPRDSYPDSIINQMLKTFDDKVIAPNREEIRHVIMLRFKMGDGSFEEGLQRILTMASLVEREAKLSQDRPMIAAVLWNRLSKRMRLEVDATVSYRPGESTQNKGRVFYSDLESDSPYNTYKHYGLPPAPICNPGLASIKAVLHPAAMDALFYVAKKDGSHVFSKTFQEHLKVKNAIKNGRL